MTAIPVERVTTLSDRIAEEIRALLGRRRMSQRQLAVVLGVSPAWLNYRLTGVQEIGVNDMQRIADAFGVPLTDLLPANLRPAQMSGQPNERLVALKKMDGQRNPRRRSIRPKERSTVQHARPVSAIPSSQRRPNPLRPGEWGMAA